jgi:hypothetical protein
MDIMTVVRLAVLVLLAGAFYGLYRSLTVNSKEYLLAHNVAHAEINATLTEYGIQSTAFVRAISSRGFVMPNSESRATQQEVCEYVARLRLLDKRISDQLFIDRRCVRQLRVTARLHAAGHHRIWRSSQQIIRALECRLMTLYNPIMSNH